MRCMSRVTVNGKRYVCDLWRGHRCDHTKLIDPRDPTIPRQWARFIKTDFAGYDLVPVQWSLTSCCDNARCRQRLAKKLKRPV